MRDRGRSSSPKTAPRGQSMVELALLLPVIALILVGTVDLGRVFFAYTRLTNAVKEGALYGSYTPNPAPPVRDRAYAEADGRLGTTGADFVIGAGDVLCYAGLSQQVKSCAQVAKGDTIQVTGRYAFKPLTASIIGIWGNPFWIRKSARMSITAGFQCDDDYQQEGQYYGQYGGYCDGNDDDDDGNGN